MSKNQQRFFLVISYIFVNIPYNIQYRPRRGMRDRTQIIKYTYYAHANVC